MRTLALAGGAVSICTFVVVAGGAASRWGAMVVVTQGPGCQDGYWGWDEGRPLSHQDAGVRPSARAMR